MSVLTNEFLNELGATDYASAMAFVAGAENASTTANFFEQYPNADTHNSDRGEFPRGANSILFGLGNPAGIIRRAWTGACGRWPRPIINPAPR